jgi:hypothetical protein
MELLTNNALNVLCLQPLHISQAPGDLDSTPSTTATTTTIPVATRVTKRRRREHDPNSDIVSPRAREIRRPARRV